ncbi:MAG: Arm DNA-binding domain-containing protein [Coprococcus phoceensis]
MAVIKNQKTGMWEVRTYYKDWTGTRRQKTKRGFAKKSEAQEWERAFKLKDEMNINMKFKDFAELYLSDIQPRIKYNSFLTKKHIIETKILPYFGHRKLNEIRPADVIQWQNEIMKLKKDNGEAYSPTYLKTIHNQLSAILNHAVNMYDLKDNVARKAGSMGKEESKEIMFWTQEEYQAFIEQVADKPISYYAFEILYWTGIREGDDDDKIRLNQRKPSKYKGLRRFGPEKNLQRINKFMKERPIFYKNLIQMKENFRFYLRCFYCITKVVILQFNSEKQDRISS